VKRNVWRRHRGDCFQSQQWLCHWEAFELQCQKFPYFLSVPQFPWENPLTNNNVSNTKNRWILLTRGKRRRNGS
jgi:hypothetical protein